jgi:hypothetical protein
VVRGEIRATEGWVDDSVSCDLRIGMRNIHVIILLGGEIGVTNYCTVVLCRVISCSAFIVPFRLAHARTDRTRAPFLTLGSTPHLT